MELIQSLSTSLLSPMVLAFSLGLFATLVKSDLRFPDELYTALTIYLLFAIGEHVSKSYFPHFATILYLLPVQVLREQKFIQS